MFSCMQFGIPGFCDIRGKGSSGFMIMSAWYGFCILNIEWFFIMKLLDLMIKDAFNRL